MTGRDIADLIDQGTPLEYVMAVLVEQDSADDCLDDAVRALPEFLDRAEVLMLLQAATRIVARRSE